MIGKNEKLKLLFCQELKKETRHKWSRIGTIKILTVKKVTQLCRDAVRQNECLGVWFWRLDFYETRFSFYPGGEQTFACKLLRFLIHQ